MNVYDLLRSLASGQPVDPQRARKLIDELEKVYPEFGAVRDHDCQPQGVWFPESLICRECSGPIPCPPHACMAGWDQMTSTGEHGRNVKYALKCIVCGRGMSEGEIRAG